MHRITMCSAAFILIFLSFTISSVSSSTNERKSCPETYRELRRRSDEETNRKFIDDDDDEDEDEDDMTDDQWRESVCEQTMKYIAQRGSRGKIDPVLLNTFCPHYSESAYLLGENNDELCEQEKGKFDLKRFHGSFYDSADDHDDNKRRSLRKKELKKKSAVRFIRKRMLFNGKRSH